MNIYLDIDGVLLTSDLKPANHAEVFIKYVIEKFPDSTYWLTTHCQGDASVSIQHIGHLFSPQTVELMRKIKPTSWETAKTRAIDFSVPFLWFDDNLFYGERTELQEHGVLDNWIEVSLRKDPSQLQSFIKDFPLPISQYGEVRA